MTRYDFGLTGGSTRRHLASAPLHRFAAERAPTIPGCGARAARRSLVRDAGSPRELLRRSAVGLPCITIFHYGRLVRRCPRADATVTGPLPLPGLAVSSCVVRDTARPGDVAFPGRRWPPSRALSIPSCGRHLSRPPGNVVSTGYPSHDYTERWT